MSVAFLYSLSIVCTSKTADILFFGRNVRDRNVRGQNVLAETSMDETSVAEMSELLCGFGTSSRKVLHFEHLKVRFNAFMRLGPVFSPFGHEVFGSVVVDLLHPLWHSEIVLCFVVRYFMSILVLQST